MIAFRFPPTRPYRRQRGLRLAWPLLATVALLASAIAGLTDAHAQEPSGPVAVDGEPFEPVRDPFEPLPPDPDSPTGELTEAERRGGGDRLLLVGGSVLSGRLIGFSGEHLIVRTADLGEVRVEPNQVARLSLERERVYYLQEQPGKEARAVVVSVGTDGLLTVREANQDTFTPLDYEAIHELSQTPIPLGRWRVKGSLSGSASFGNTEKLTLGLDLTVRYTTATDTLQFKFGIAFSEDQGTVTEELIQGSILYRRFLVDWFGVLVQDEVKKNETSGIRLRNAARLGASAKIDPMLDSTITFDLGLTYVYEDLITTQEDYLGLFALVSAVLQFSTQVLLLSDVSFELDFGNLERFTLNARAELQLAIDVVLSLSLVIEDTYNNTPAVGFDSNDIRFFLAINLLLDLK